LGRPKKLIAFNVLPQIFLTVRKAFAPAAKTEKVSLIELLPGKLSRRDCPAGNRVIGCKVLSFPIADIPDRISILHTLT